MAVKGKKQNIPKLGDKFTLNCGVEVVVVEYKDKENVVVSDGSVTRTVPAKRLRTGAVGWMIDGARRTKPLSDRSKKIKCPSALKKRTRKQSISIGDKFTLSCGNTVTVSLYINYHEIVVVDEFQTCYKKTSIQLRGLQPLNPAKLKPMSIGDNYKTQNYGYVEVIGFSGDDRYSVKFLDTGYTRHDVLKHLIFSGQIKDHSVRHNKTIKKYPLGSRFEAGVWGWFEVIEVKNCNEIVIRWDVTGHTQRTTDKQISTKSMYLRDESRPFAKNDYLMPVDYYVYSASDGDIVCYIGYGKGTRYLHCNSGLSSNYELNKLHFSGKTLEIKIIQDRLTKVDAVKIEEELIRSTKPLCNVVHNR